MEETTTTTKGMEAIEALLEQWKQASLEQYEIAKKDYQENRESVKNEYKAKGYKGCDLISATYHHFYDKYGSGLIVLIQSGNSRKDIDEMLERGKEARRKKLVAQVEKKAGKIVDVKDLYFGHDTGINGIIVGEKKTVKVETIYAGGYNIQCLHYRVLVK